MSTAGSQTVTVSYTEGGVLKTTTYTITVNAEAQQQTATMSYPGGTTTNMAGGGANNASLIGLSASLFTVTATKRTTGSSNFPGLNKDGTIRIYAQDGCTFTVTIASGHTIDSIVVNTSQNGQYLVVLVGENQVTASNGTYTINSSSFTISHNLPTGQIYITSIVITYT